MDRVNEGQAVKGKRERQKRGGIFEKDGFCQLDIRAPGIKRLRILTEYPYNPTGIRLAGKERDGVIRRIRNGTFNLAEEFPESRVAKRVENGVITFEVLRKKYLGTITRKALSTQDGEECMLRCIGRMPISTTSRTTLDKMPLDQVKHSNIQHVFAQYTFATNKSFNTYLGSVRRAFALAVRDDLIRKNPVDGIEPLRIGKKLPVKGYTVQEAEKIIIGFRDLFGPGWMNYVIVGFFCGLRPSELIALMWTDIDLSAGIMRVTHARVKGRDKDTKTLDHRIVPLCPRAKAALIAQRQITGQAEHGAIFEGLTTGKPIHDLQRVIGQWHEAIEHVGLTHLGLKPKHMRKSSVTWNLTIASSPIDIARIADMHGHDAATMMTYYAAVQKVAPTEEDKQEIRDAMNRTGQKLAAVA